MANKFENLKNLANEVKERSAPALDVAKKGYNVGKKGYKTGKKVKKEVDHLNNRGLDGYVADKAKKKAKKLAWKSGKALAKTTGKAAMSALRTAITWLISNPIGWVMLVVVLLILVAIASESNIGTSLSGDTDKQNQTAQITKNGMSDETLAVLLATACPPEQSNVKVDGGTGKLVSTDNNPFLVKIGGDTKNAQKIITWAKSNGFSGGQIAAILAIGARESGLNPKADNPLGGVHGVFQHSNGGPNGDRMKWLRDQGGDINSLDDQLKLVKHELSTTHKATITGMSAYQSTSDEDLVGNLRVWNEKFEGVSWSDGQTKSDVIFEYAKGVLEAFPELRGLKQAANFLSNFSAGNSDGNNVSNKVSKTQEEFCGNQEMIGGDAFAQALIRDAFRYWGGGIKYSQGSNRGQVTWNSNKSRVTGGYLDCSAFVTTVLRDMGVEGVSLGSTETLFGYKGTILQEIDRSEVTTGDIFVVGTPGQSGGNGGHTGFFLNKNWIIHCSTGWYNNGKNGGDIFINEYPDNNFGLEPHFFRVISRELPAEMPPAPEDFVDITTNETLAAAIKSGKIEDRTHGKVDAGQSNKDISGGGSRIKGKYAVNRTPNYAGDLYPHGECTWGAKAMAPWASNGWGNGGQWATNARRDGFKTGSTPVPGALICWDDGRYGHIAYVTDVKGSQIKVMESNYNNKRYVADHRGWFNPIGIQGRVTYIYPKK